MGKAATGLTGPRTARAQTSTPEALRISGDAEKALRDSDLVEQAVKQGEKAPLFELPNAKGKKIAMASPLKRGAVVLVFYRGAWCPYCNIQLQAMQRVLPEIKSLGATRVAVTPEKPDSARALIDKHGLAFEVLTDHDNVVARKYRIAFEIPRRSDDLHMKYGLDVKAKNDSDRAELPLVATYVISDGGAHTAQTRHEVNEEIT